MNSESFNLNNREFLEKIINDFVESIGEFGIPGFKFREPFYLLPLIEVDFIYI